MASSSDLTLQHRQESAGELATSPLQAAAIQDAQSRVILAHKFPRSQAQAIAEAMEALDNFELADAAEYEYPRFDSAKGKNVSIMGPSVYLMRVLACAWGNIEYGTVPVAETDEAIIGRAHSWDLQKNVFRSEGFIVHKLQQRKVKGKDETQWVQPDERDLRELYFNIAARRERKCLEQIIPTWFTDMCVAKARAVMEAKVKEDPHVAVAKLIEGFRALRVMPKDLEAYLGHGLDNATPAEIAKLRGIWKALRDGQATWADYGPGERMETSVSLAGITPGADQNRGHGKEQPSAAPEPDQTTGKPPAAPETDAYRDAALAFRDAAHAWNWKPLEIEEEVKRAAHSADPVKTLLDKAALLGQQKPPEQKK